MSTLDEAARLLGLDSELLAEALSEQAVRCGREAAKAPAGTADRHWWQGAADACNRAIGA